MVYGRNRMVSKKNFLNKISNGIERNINKFNLLVLATSLITLNPVFIGIGTFNVAVTNLSNYGTFIKLRERKIKKINEVIDSLNSLPENEKDEEVNETIDKLLSTKELYEKEILRLKALKAELYKKSINKKAKKLSKPIIKKQKSKK